MTHCRDIGEMKQCPDNALSCMVEVRKRDGDLESVSSQVPLEHLTDFFRFAWAARRLKPVLIIRLRILSDHGLSASADRVKILTGPQCADSAAIRLAVSKRLAMICPLRQLLGRRISWSDFE